MQTSKGKSEPSWGPNVALTRAPGGPRTILWKPLRYRNQGTLLQSKRMQVAPVHVVSRVNSVQYIYGVFHNNPVYGFQKQKNVSYNFPSGTSLELERQTKRSPTGVMPIKAHLTKWYTVYEHICGFQLSHVSLLSVWFTVNAIISIINILNVDYLMCLDSGK